MTDERQNAVLPRRGDAHPSTKVLKESLNGADRVRVARTESGQSELDEFSPVEIRGEPLSATVIRERR